MIYAQPASTFEAFLHGAPTGLVGTLTYRLVDDDGTVYTATTTAGITEPLTGVYRREDTAPDTKGTYLVVWLHGTTQVAEELTVVDTLPAVGAVIPPDARARLVSKLAPDMEPILTTADIDGLLTRAQRVDANGLYPTDTGYVPTWTSASLDAAASEGWEIRAARCFDDIDFGEDGQRFNTAQRHKACIDMARLYRRGAGSVTLGSAVTAR